MGDIMSKESFLEDVYQKMKEDGIIDVMGGYYDYITKICII